MNVIGVKEYSSNKCQYNLMLNRPVFNINFSNKYNLKTDTVSFKKQYSPKERNMENVSVVELMAHNYLDLRRNAWGSSIVYDELSPHNISEKLRENFLDVITKLGPSVQSNANLVEWKAFLNADYKAASCKGVNKARSDRLKDFSAVNNIRVNKENLSENVSLYIEKLKNNAAYQFLAMIIAFNDVKESNRHIPLPFDIEVLAKTFAQIDTKREIISIDRLSNLYHSNLIENALLKNTEKIIHIDEKTDISNMKQCWVCIPGRGENDVLQDKLINLVEIFSNKNWCTHSREDKAKAQVETGDFFVYLKRDEDNNWSPMTAISTDNHYKKHNKLGVIEIQGIKNNYILTNDDYERIKVLIRKNNQVFKFKHKDINCSVPSACVQMAIMEYLEKNSPLVKAISDIRIANEQKEDLKIKHKQFQEKIKLLKPSSNLSMNIQERVDIENEVRQIDRQVKNIELALLNIEQESKPLCNNLLVAIGASPENANYSVIDAMDVVNKILGLPDNKEDIKININSKIADELATPKLEEKIYPTIDSTQVTIPIKAIKEDFSKKVFLNHVINHLYKIDLNDITTSESLLSLGTYNPIIDLDYNNKEKRPYSKVPLMYFGVDEDALLSNVKNIDVFYMKNSGIKKFPKKLSKVNELHCNDIQYRKFKNEINVLQSRNPQMKLFITVAK